MKKPTKIAQQMKLSDLKAYEKVWKLRDRPEDKRYTWDQIKEHFELKQDSKSVAKWFERLAKKLKKPYKKRGEKLKKSEKK